MRTVLAAIAAVLFFATSSSAHAQSRALSPEDIFRQSQATIVTIVTTDSFGKTFRGTGFFIAPTLIATNHHVIRAARDLRIEGANNTSFTFLRTRARDPDADTAVIEVKERSPQYLRLDPITRINVGQTVYVIGNPQGYTRSLSQGLVSGIRTRDTTPIYQVTATVSQGSSGSPVLDEWGRAIGIVFGRLPNEAQIAFAIPAANLVALRDGNWRPTDTEAPGIDSAARNLPPSVVPASLPSDTPKGAPSQGLLRIGLTTWDSAIVMAHILKAAIERFFPIGVELIPGSNQEIYASIRRSDRSYDVHPDVWLPVHRRFVTDNVHVTARSYTATKGICVPRYVLRRYSVRSLVDLANPTIARLFDLDNDGRGDIWIGHEGWEATKVQRLKARDYRYAPYFNLVTGDESDFYTRLDHAISVQKPIVFFCYGPHWILRKHDLAILREEPHRPDCFHLADEETGQAWYDRSLAACESPPSTVHRAYSDYVTEKLPGVSAFLENFSISYEELNDLIFRMLGSGRDNVTVARTWVEQNETSIRRHVAAGTGNQVPRGTDGTSRRR